VIWIKSAHVYVRARPFAIVRVCSLILLCVFLFVGVILWMCVWLCMLTSPVFLDFVHDTRQHNAECASGVMCRVLSLAADYYFKNDPRSPAV
jgi:hypothetical protein